MGKVGEMEGREGCEVAQNTVRNCFFATKSNYKAPLLHYKAKEMSS